MDRVGRWVRVRRTSLHRQLVDAARRFAHVTVVVVDVAPHAFAFAPLAFDPFRFELVLPHGRVAIVLVILLLLFGRVEPTFLFFAIVCRNGRPRRRGRRGRSVRGRIERRLSRRGVTSSALRQPRRGDDAVDRAFPGSVRANLGRQFLTGNQRCRFEC